MYTCRRTRAGLNPEPGTDQFKNRLIIDEYQIANDPQGGTNHPKSLFADFNFGLILIGKTKFDKIVKIRCNDWIPAYAGRTSMVSI